MRLIRAVFFLLIIPICLSQAETIEPIAPPFTGNLQFGYTGAYGSNQDDNVNAGTNVLYEKDKWTNTFNFNGVFSSHNNVTTSERYAGTLEFNYHLRKRLFVFARNNSVYDSFNAYLMVINNAAGAGLRLIDNPNFSVDVQGGPGYRQEVINSSNEIIRENTAYFGSTLNWNISETSAFQEMINIDSGKSNTILQTQTSLTMDIVNNFGMSFSLLTTRNSQIPPGSTNTQKTDYLTEVTFIYNF